MKRKTRVRKQPDYVKIKIPRELAGRVTATLESRGTDLETYLAVTLACFYRTNRPLGLEDEVNFGKFAGAKVEDAIRVDPSYFVWLLGQGRADKFKREALELIRLLGNVEMS